jgi:hypothetical protein
MRGKSGDVNRVPYFFADASIKMRRVSITKGGGHADQRCGLRPLGATSSLPHPPAPAFGRPVDVVTGPAIDAVTFGNIFDGRPYHPA